MCDMATVKAAVLPLLSLCGLAYQVFDKEPA